MPLRLLDCKEASCQGLIAEAPVIDDYLSEASKSHDAYLRQGLEALGIAYEHDPRLVRGLDYYTKTVFEFVLNAEIGSQAATICGGGRYDGLVEQLGGSAVPGIGFSIGEERLLMALREEGLLPELNTGVDLFVAAQSDAARLPVAVLGQRLRELGLAVETDLMGRSLKAQMKYANKSGARYALVIGDAELETETAPLRDLRSREVEDRFVEFSEPAPL